MSEMIVNRESLQSVADKIKAKAGTTGDLVFPEGFENAVDGISGGDTTVEDGLLDGTLTEYSNPRVTNFSEYVFREAADLKSVDFPLVTSIGNIAFYSCSKLEIANFPSATSIGDFAFQKCSNLKTANSPLVTSIGNSAFDRCESLTSADFPLITSIGTNTFNECDSLTSVDFPLVTSIGNGAFYRCSKLEIANFPSATSIGSNTFRYCSNLKTVDFSLVTSIGTYCFEGCYLLTVVTLRSDALCALSNTNAFSNCYRFHGTVHSAYNPEGLKDSYIYVPSALIEDYKAATNWSTFATQFRALEDYTVDGTTTGALDETKIGA